MSLPEIEPSPGPSAGAVGSALPDTPFWRRALRSPGLRAIALFVGIGGLLAIGLVEVGGASGLRERLGSPAIAILVPLQAVVAVSPFPSEAVALGISSAYGFWLGALLGWCGWLLAALVQYLIARRTARDFDFDHARTRLPAWLRRFPVSHPAFLIGAHWVPYGPHVKNAAAGAFEVPLGRHLWCAGVGILPVALFVAGLGDRLFGS